MRFLNGKRPRPPGAGAQVPANPAAPARPGALGHPTRRPGPGAGGGAPPAEHLGAACAPVAGK